MMNKIALNLLKTEKIVKVGVKTKRLKAGWGEAYMMKVLTVGFISACFSLVMIIICIYIDGLVVYVSC